MTITVDTRTVAHTDSGPGSTLEWVLSLSVSLATELPRDRLRISLPGADGMIFRPINGESTEAAARLLATITDVEPSRRAFLEGCLVDPNALGIARIVIVGLGLLRSRDAAALAVMTARVVDIDALVPGTRAFRLSADVVTAREKVCQLLTISRWNVAIFGPEAAVPQGWGRLAA